MSDSSRLNYPGSSVPQTTQKNEWKYMFYLGRSFITFFYVPQRIYDLGWEEYVLTSLHRD